MEKFVSSWSDGKTLPENYIFPPGKRPGEQVVPITKSVPVIDLSKAEGNARMKVVHQIIEAAQEFGFFLVINHGVPTRLMDDTLSMFKEFFDLPAEEKSRFLSSDLSRKFILLTSFVDYDKEEIHNWRDSLRQVCNPLEECIQHWPQQPTKYREVVGEYTIKVRELGSRILELITEGLGLEPDFLAKELSQEHIMSIHQYPPCPDPSLTLGSRTHCDTDLITILFQDIPGLQVLKDGEWLGIEAIPYAFVVNIGHQLHMISNGKLRSAEHRAVTNKDRTRTSAAYFIAPTMDSTIEPAKAIVNAQNPPIYKSVRNEDFIKTFRAAYIGEIDDALEPYKI